MKESSTSLQASIGIDEGIARSDQNLIRQASEQNKQESTVRNRLKLKQREEGKWQVIISVTEMSRCTKAG